MMGEGLGKGIVGTATVLLAATAVAVGCGGDDSDDGGGGSAERKPCVASFGHMGPLTGPAAALGQEQLNWNKFAVERFNEENGTEFTLVEGDTQLDPSQASTVAREFAANDDIVATVGPADSASTQAAGPIFQRVDLAMVGMSATAAELTGGDYPTFFRVNGSNIQQVPTVVDWLKKLGAKKVFIVDDQSVDKTALADAVQEEMEGAGAQVERASVNPEQQADLTPLTSRVDDSVDAVFLAWEIAAKAQDFGERLRQQGKKAELVGSSGLFGTDFKIEGAYITSFAPDITKHGGSEDLIEAYRKEFGQFGTFGPPTYVASNVVMEAIKKVCDDGNDPNREDVLAAIEETDMPESILGYPIKFDENGDAEGAQFPMFQIKKGKPVEVEL